MRQLILTMMYCFLCFDLSPTVTDTRRIDAARVWRDKRAGLDGIGSVFGRNSAKFGHPSNAVRGILEAHKCDGRLRSVRLPGGREYHGVFQYFPLVGGSGRDSHSVWSRPTAIGHGRSG